MYTIQPDDQNWQYSGKTIVCPGDYIVSHAGKNYVFSMADSLDLIEAH